jgi:hypothetical protein
MLSLERDYARLEISADAYFGDVSQAVRTLFQLCRVNTLRGALIVSGQSPTDWKSCMRVGIRIADIRGVLPESKLALVVQRAGAKQRDDVCEAAKDAGLVCRVFEDERSALAWLKEPGLRVVPAA